jgi:predicted ribonuclease toxin of YeeF-YezG toxin-antitoxin module
MKFRQILIATMILATLCHYAAAQPKKKRTPADAPPPEGILASTSMQSNPDLSDLIALKPEMPLGPQDVLKSYEIAMSMVADKTSADFSVIVQAQQTSQITREQAEYLLLQSYQMAMMQYQVLSALHDVLKHDIDEAAVQQARQSLKATSSNTVLVVPFPGSAPASR